jgi:hypothetical protein
MTAKCCRRLDLARPTTALLVGLFTLPWIAPAAAYRPFDGTDAAVADVGEVEVELQPAGLLHEGPRNALVAPAVVYNYGFAERWEMVLQTQAETPFSPAGRGILTDNGVFLKNVLRPGTLQDKTGPSIATEFGLLLPDVNAEQGVGASWSGIVSQRWEWGTVQLNLMTNLTRDQRGELFVDAILEGPSKWPIRPVMELYSDSVSDQSQTFSGLVGAIWQVRDNLAFDVGLRQALVNGHPVSELRLGLTFGIPTGRPSAP